MINSNSLSEYNEATFKELRGEYPDVQLGFFNGNRILFIGQNPGRPYNNRTKQMTDKILANDDYLAFEEEYEMMLTQSRIGKYVEKLIDSWEDVSFTNIVKVPTTLNEQPDNELYELFFPVLLKQIEILQPHLIVCLGKYAGAVFGLDEFYYARGYATDCIVCMYPHPSHLLRKSIVEMKWEQGKIKASIDELLEMKVHYEITE